MKNSIATIILGIALVVLGSAFTRHVYTTEITKPIQQEAPAEAPADSSWLWTDFSHPDTIDYTDSVIEKKYTSFGSYRYNVRSYYLKVVYSYHGNGIPALSYSEYLDTDNRNAKDDFISKLMVYRSSGGNIKAAYDFNRKRWFCAAVFDDYYAVGINAFRDYDSAIHVGIVTKNPESCPEPTRGNHIYNHQVKD